MPIFRGLSTESFSQPVAVVQGPLSALDGGKRPTKVVSASVANYQRDRLSQQVEGCTPWSVSGGKSILWELRCWGDASTEQLIGIRRVPMLGDRGTATEYDHVGAVNVQPWVDRY